MCRIRQEQLQHYIDGTLDQLEKAVLEEHLRTCGECRRELNLLKILDWDLQRHFQEEIIVPADLAVLRSNVLENCFREEAETRKEKKEGDITFKDVLSLQVTTIRNSVKFLGFIPGLSNRRTIRKIIGF